MERFYICVNGHSFKVLDPGVDPREETREVYFGVTCPVCGSIYEIRWPGSRAFKVLAI